MSNEQSIKETLDVIRRALEDDNSSDKQNDIFLLNRKVNSDGTINTIKNVSVKSDDIKKILDEKIDHIFEKHLDQWLEKKLPYYIKKYSEKK